jgi:recombination protein RecA
MSALPGALKRFEESFSKSFGPDVLRRSNEIKPYEVIPTGSLALDYATGIGGLPEGRITEFWGIDGSGKSTVALLATAEAQKKYPEKMVGFVDMEQALDLDWAQKLGVNLELMYHVQPDSAEDLADIVKAMLASGAMSLIVVDSIGGMITEEETEKAAEKDVVGTLAKVVTRMVKIAAVEARKAGTAVLLLNQVRAAIGAYGPTTTTGGGFALKHATTMRMKFRRTGTPAYTLGSGDDAEQVGVEIAVVVEKSKVSPPKRVALIGLFNQSTEKYGPLGVDKANEATDLALRVGLIQRAGAWYTLASTGERFQGKDSVRDYLRQHLDEVELIRKHAIASRSHEVVSEEAPLECKGAGVVAADNPLRKLLSDG